MNGHVVVVHVRSDEHAISPRTHNHNSSVSQFRPPVGKEVLELPAGLVDDGEVREAPYVSCCSPSCASLHTFP